MWKNTPIIRIRKIELNILGHIMSKDGGDYLTIIEKIESNEKEESTEYFCNEYVY